MEARRLIKLAEHLESGKLAHKEFNFRFITNNDANVFDEDELRRVNYCGTAGCALGEMPAAFPSKFKWIPGGVALRGSLKNGDTAQNFTAAEAFFDISEDDSIALFDPAGRRERDDRGLGQLSATSTAAQVAANIRMFVANNLASEK